MFKLEDIQEITILDLINWNYQSIQSFEFKITIGDSIKLWNTNKIKKSEFRDKYLKDKLNELRDENYKKYGYNSGSIYRDLTDEQKEAGKKLSEFQRQYTTEKYNAFLSKSKDSFIKELDKTLLEKLIYEIQSAPLQLEEFKIQYDKKDKFNFNLRMTSYYPLLKMTVLLKNGAEFKISSKSQLKIILPWKINDTEIYNYNPLINKILFKIIPKNLNYNRKRLLKGIKSKV